MVMLATAGAPHAQESSGGEPRRAARLAEQPPAGEQEGGGIRARIESGLAEVFSSGRLHVHLNASYQGSSRQSDLETSFPTYGERSRFLTHESFEGGGHIDGGGSVRVWRSLALGASYTQVRNAGSAVVSGMVPHPLDAGRDRTVPTRTLSLPHRQRAVHGYVAWRKLLREALEVELSAGPTYFSLRQGVVATLAPVEVTGPPFLEVGLHVGAGEHTRNGAGFNAGIDITYMFTPATRIPELGVGYFVRFARGSVSLPLSADSWRRVTVGGVQTGAGLRFRF